MNSLPISVLFIILGLMVILSALFSSSETGMMALNKYRLKHKVKQGHKGAIKAQKLLKKPDRLLGVILLGNNFVNIFASSIATIIAMRLMGEAGIALAAGILTLVILIFAEVAPKTLAALYPEKIAFPAAYVLDPLLKLLSPLVWFVNFFANNFLRLFGVKVKHQDSDQHALSKEELQTLINEATGRLPKHYRSMLTGIMQLETITVEDVMIPKQDIYGIDVNEPLDTIVKRIMKSPFTRIPVYRDNMDDELIGIINLRKMLPILTKPNLSLKDIIKATRPGYFIPETTTLNIQLSKFNKHKRHMALIVDEYGNLQGLLTLEDLLEEIVGKFTTDNREKIFNTIKTHKDGSITFDASEFIRDVNKTYQFDLPTDGPKTLNGLIQEELETLPAEGTCLKIGNYTIEVVETSNHAIEQIKLKEIDPSLRFK
ncbi:MAG: magnesium/cobalt efflux protein [Piscirickettsiaceae bacterium CG_4_9_14_3_um_filter_43_564]|nr:HlyC/CorC family transporter [Thiomicrospira sp.]OIP95528.1 MAG: magnesium/cobalt efflux protein [Thiomicrospira sp. CG2_30_44_34]PIQ03713.1 MAG: magnesium/cobalt efflux protein [Piscirickettsiaceae bacterium CG18_big_fil_WC_8_21_14_2_50_44_103]PIU39053.1 MAG: magnesium/cobalt efflux protein [Piscirickettsiaceae bacterium CG07_land_8_20_14_0_80_44_28]PIW57016.1 MAG: magnesium/cobalt efflux protein [Piscirickettsiaceae bacterium CG12_big_fil_rev_8_21_14_0_65_44_934]PIW77875.1 MAG: magnesium/